MARRGVVGPSPSSSSSLSSAPRPSALGSTSHAPISTAAANSAATAATAAPSHSPPSDTDEPAPKKQKRVTKACDQCRRRRIKCEAFPNAPSIDSPCVVCTENGTASSCTFTRPTRKRGPQAGYAKSLADRVTGFERFIGHLIVVEGKSAFMAKAQAFFDQDDLSNDPSAQLAAWNNSPLPYLLEHLVINSVAIGATIKDEAQDYAGSTGSRDVKMDGSSPATGPPTGPFGSEPSPVASTSTQFDHSSLGATTSTTSNINTRSYDNAPALSRYGAPIFAGIGSTSTSDHAALQTLAHAAMPDYYYQEPQGDSPTRTQRALEIEGVGSTSPSASPETLSLPNEATRNQMLDLYFHQIVHPSLPMLDKARFFRWSAHLPTTDAAHSFPARALPAELYLSVFATVAPYLHSGSTHSSEAFASAARSHLFSAIRDPTVETVQACCLLAIADWGLNELSRAWVLSSLSIALSITLGLHRSREGDDSIDPHATRLRTFHSAMIVHTLLSLRSSRAPIVNFEDFDVPLPPHDGAENFEVWRLGHSPDQLRAEHGLDPSPTTTRSHGAVRSSTLATFAKMASLCALGIATLRWSLKRHAEGGGEIDRQGLVNALVAWERDLPLELTIGEPSARGVERVAERSRATIEMHMILHSLYLRLAPRVEAFADGGGSAFDPAPESTSMLIHLTRVTRDLFSYFRTMPLVEGTLHALVEIGHGGDEAVRGAYEELGQVHRLGRAKDSIATPRSVTTPSMTGHTPSSSSMALLTNLHPPTLPRANAALAAPAIYDPTLKTSAEVAPTSEIATTSAEPFQAFLSYSDLLGPTATPSTVLDFGSWDQSDLLVSLGLVSDPTIGSQAWPPPSADAPSRSFQVQPLPMEHETGSMIRPALGASGEFDAAGLGGGGGGDEGMPGEGTSANFGMDQYGQGTDLLSRWLDRGSWAAAGMHHSQSSSGHGAGAAPGSVTAMMLDQSSSEGMML